MEVNNEPYEQGRLDVGNGHTLYYEQYGSPEGLPVVFLHGGPGGGLHPAMSSFFDLERYRVVLFDQRGCGKSTPLASVEFNSISDLVNDIEKIREHLSIKKWIVAGVSWGTALAMLYASHHEDKIRAMILNGVFFADDHGRDWLVGMGGGGNSHEPELFRRFSECLPENKQSVNIALACDEIFQAGSKEDKREVIKKFITYDIALIKGTLSDMDQNEIQHQTEKFYPLCRIYFHYAARQYSPENRMLIFETAKKLSRLDISSAIFHGQEDRCCPVEYAVALHSVWPGSKLNILPDCGHSMRSEIFFDAVKKYTDNLWKELI